jgi:tetraacyldisaccharide 4'-kinase
VRVLVSDGSSVLADAVTGGDEPVELAGKLIGKATVIADADRISAAKWATRKFGVTAFVLDDGFQHRRAKRDVDIVCIDAMNPFDSGHVLPGGQLRESIGGLRRADAIVITRSDLVADIAEVRQRIKEYAPDAKIFLSSTRITGLRAIEHSGTQDPTKTAGTKVFAFCALGNPRNFFELLARENFEIAGTKVFRDHHRYSQDDIEAISQAATNARAEMLLTTAKDAVKLDGAGFKIPCRVVEISVDVNDLEEFRKLVTGSG